MLEKPPHPVLDWANKLIFVKCYDEALEALEAYLASPEGNQDLLTHFRRIELGVKLGDFPILNASYGEVSDPENEVWRMAVVFCKQQSKSMALGESIQEFQHLMQIFGESAAGYFGIGFAYEMQGNFERALFNYEQSVKLDPYWSPSYFGLSQIYYHRQNDPTGDSYFFMFESLAPFNLYGNFETHKLLCLEFLELERFHEAESALITLGDWWQQNKKMTPYEIRVYEALMLSYIAAKQGLMQKEKDHLARAEALCHACIREEHVSEKSLYFIAKICEEFSMFPWAFLVYKSILSRTGNSTAMAQKIGGQFISLGQFALAKELFDDGYKHNPNNLEMRFCRLVAQLKLSKVNVEDYLFYKDRIRQILEKSQASAQEIVPMLHHLQDIYEADPDVHRILGDCDTKDGHLEAAWSHYKRMYELDQHGLQSSLKYASFCLRQGSLHEAKDALDHINADEKDYPTEFLEVCWLRANYQYRMGHHDACLDILNALLYQEPWNLSYVLQKVLALTKIYYSKEDDGDEDHLDALQEKGHILLKWNHFHEKTKRISIDHHYDLVYSRAKLSYLYKNGDPESLQYLVLAAKEYNPEVGIHEFLKLLNTNFDSPKIYFSLGLLFKELWQLETAAMWFEQVVQKSTLDHEFNARIHTELAECYLLQNKHLKKSLEFLKLAQELAPSKEVHPMYLMVHAYLRMGDVRQAKILLDKLPSMGLYAQYLRGLLSYRHGAIMDAKKIWKPLIAMKIQNVSQHHLKQEIMRYYFEGGSYPTVRLSMG